MTDGTAGTPGLRELARQIVGDVLAAPTTVQADNIVLAHLDALLRGPDGGRTAEQDSVRASVTYKGGEPQHRVRIGMDAGSDRAEARVPAGGPVGGDALLARTQEWLEAEHESPLRIQRAEALVTELRDAVLGLRAGVRGLTRNLIDKSKLIQRMREGGPVEPLIRAFAKDIDFAIDVTEPMDVRLCRFEDILRGFANAITYGKPIRELGRHADDPDNAVAHAPDSAGVSSAAESGSVRAAAVSGARAASHQQRTASQVASTLRPDTGGADRQAVREGGSLPPAASPWQTVKAQSPKPHEKYLVNRDGWRFVATPCYGMHEPWWVPATWGPGYQRESEPIAMLDTDEWMPLPDPPPRATGGA